MMNYVLAMVVTLAAAPQLHQTSSHVASAMTLRQELGASATYNQCLFYAYSPHGVVCGTAASGWADSDVSEEAATESAKAKALITCENALAATGIIQTDGKPLCTLAPGAGGCCGRRATTTWSIAASKSDPNVYAVGEGPLRAHSWFAPLEALYKCAMLVDSAAVAGKVGPTTDSLYLLKDPARTETQTWLQQYCQLVEPLESSDYTY